MTYDPSARNAVFDDFWAFHLAHPELRFWQAVREWSGEPYILVSRSSPHEWDCLPEKAGGEAAGVSDTFYWEGRNGDDAPNGSADLREMRDTITAPDGDGITLKVIRTTQ